MDILVPDSWLREFLKTKATAKDIARCLSLCGPSVERVITSAGETIYAMEITTNRVDAAGVYGIAREAAAILPRFEFKTKLLQLNAKSKIKLSSKVKYLKVKINSNLCPRFCAVLIKNVNIKASSPKIQNRLRAVGLRPINNVVDISNYLMHELGQPMHTFDYDKIRGQEMILRTSKPGERISTLDGLEYQLPGGDIIISDASGRLIDLAGIMGGLNSCVEESTKNVLLFVQTYNPIHIRRTSMKLAKRSEASSLFEKGLDPELVEIAIKRGIDLFVAETQGRPETTVLDIYPKPYKAKRIVIKPSLIEERLGIKIGARETAKILESLGFETIILGSKLRIDVPSFRAGDISIPEDILEEIARIYGYHNLPSHMLAGSLPAKRTDTPFTFEKKTKDILAALGGIEIYTSSLVSKQMAGQDALRIVNPLGKDLEYLRTELRPSLEKAARENPQAKEPFFLFELANVYLPRKKNLPEERMHLGIIFRNYDYRVAKGIVESLLSELNIGCSLEVEDGPGYPPNHRLSLKTQRPIGEFGLLSSGMIYLQADMEELRKASRETDGVQLPSKFPPQIEDLTLIFPPRTRIGEVMDYLSKNIKLISSLELLSIYANTYTLRLWYSHPEKTLTNKEVERIRNKILSGLQKKFGGRIKT